MFDCEACSGKNSDKSLLAKISQQTHRVVGWTADGADRKRGSTEETKREKQEVGIKHHWQWLHLHPHSMLDTYKAYNADFIWFH